MTPVPKIDTTLTATDEEDISTTYGVDVDDVQSNVEVTGSSITGTSKYVDSIELSDMTIDQIKALATELGYTITKTLKADIIEEFLSQQNGEE